MTGQVQSSASPVTATTNDCLNVSGQVEASTSACNGVLMAGDKGREEYAADVLVKFFMSRNISLDVIKDPNFQTLLKSVAQHGQRSCDLLKNSTVIQKSLWNFEHEIKNYMQIVAESWKITGCSVMTYNLKGGKQNKLVLGFYCPKGFIFLEVSPSKEAVRNALADLVPDSSHCIWHDVIQYVQHDPSYHSECQYQAFEHNYAVWDSFTAHETKCVWQQIQVLWRSICRASKWVQSLIKKSDEIHEYIVTSDLYARFYTSLKRRWKPTCSFSRIGMVMEVEFELRDWLSQLNEEQIFHLDNYTDITTIINNSEFWNDGNELLRVLTPFFKIPSLMDALVPTAGYLEPAIHQANGLLKTYSEHQPLKYKQILNCVDGWRVDCFHPAQDVTCFFNPSYVSRQDMQENMRLVDYDSTLERFIRQDEEDLLFEEIDDYSIKSSNPFANVSASECEANHPITLWSKYGGEFPLLQKCAYKLLSKPACCLCKQVEKHASKLEGSDNYILRLNGLMMEEFAKIGDGIYQPIHCRPYNSQLYWK